MYGIFTYIWVIYGVNVGKYTIHVTWMIWEYLGYTYIYIYIICVLRPGSSVVTGASKDRSRPRNFSPASILRAWPLHPALFATKKIVRSSDE